MNVRIAVEHVGASVDLDGSWTPELLETLLRMCGDEVLRICRTLGVEPVEDGETSDETSDETGVVEGE